MMNSETTAVRPLRRRVSDYLTPEQIVLAQYMSDANGATPAEALRLYGSPNRPMSGSWARIPGAAYITADVRDTGLHTWVVVPDEIDPALVESYELRLVV
jgi:hypothetical protein